MGNTHCKNNEICYIINKNDMKIYHLPIIEKNINSKFKYFTINNKLGNKLNDIDFILTFKDSDKGFDISTNISPLNKGQNIFNNVSYNKIEKDEFVDFTNDHDCGISIKLRCNRYNNQPRYIVIEYNR